MNKNKSLFVTLLLILSIVKISIAGPDWFKNIDAQQKKSNFIQTAIDKKTGSQTVKNWIENVIRVKAVGTANVKETVNLGQAYILAEKAARALAYEKLAEAVSEVKVTGATTLEDALIKNQKLQVEVYSLVKNATEYREPAMVTLKDGSPMVTVYLEMKLRGEQSPTAALESYIKKIETSRKPVWYEGTYRPDITKEKNTEKLEAASVIQHDSPITGLVVQCKGLNVIPSQNPKILTKDNKEIYGYLKVDSRIFKEYGLVGYSLSVKDALRKTDRIGNNPIIIKAVESSGNGTSVIIQNKDAYKLFKENSKSSFLKKCAVIFVVN